MTIEVAATIMGKVATTLASTFFFFFPLICNKAASAIEKNYLGKQSLYLKNVYCYVFRSDL
jgi:hypothetical protein